MVAKLHRPRLRLTLTEKYLDERFVTVKGITIRYVVTGEGPPLLLVHGFGAYIEAWWLNIRPLSERYRVYAFDLPGHGLSDRPAIDCTLSLFTELVIDFMEAVGVERASVLGHSMGGFLSLNAAVNFSERVDKLILVDSIGLAKRLPRRYWFYTLPVLGEMLMLPTTKANVERGLRRSFYNPDFVTPEMVEISYQFLKLPGAKHAMLNILRSNKGPGGSDPEGDVINTLRSVKSPTLAIHGAQDGTIPLAGAREACRLIPDARLKIFEECGHCPHIEKALEFNEAVIAFLDGKLLD